MATGKVKGAPKVRSVPAARLDKVASLLFFLVRADLLGRYTQVPWNAYQHLALPRSTSLQDGSSKCGSRTEKRLVR